jgi:carbamoyltransferase
MLFVYPVKERQSRPHSCRPAYGWYGACADDQQSPTPTLLRFDQRIQELTGVPVLVNTSFNTRGEPIVCTPRDAIECFWTSPFDALIINSFILEK